MSFRLTLALGLLSGVALVGCTRPEPAPSPDLVTEELPATPDARVDPDLDPKGIRPAAELAGALPGDFPSSFPLPPGASVVDFGEDDRGRYVTLFAQGGSGWAGRLPSRLATDGWEASSAPNEYERGGRWVAVHVEPESTNLRIRIDYR